MNECGRGDDKLMKSCKFLDGDIAGGEGGTGAGAAAEEVVVVSCLGTGESGTFTDGGLVLEDDEVFTGCVGGVLGTIDAEAVEKEIPVSTLELQIIYYFCVSLRSMTQ